MRLVLHTLSLAALFQLVSLPAHSTPMLDQVHDQVFGINRAHLAIRSVEDGAQTFTVGITGTLTQLDLRIRKSGTDPNDNVCDVFLSVICKFYFFNIFAPNEGGNKKATQT